MLLGPKVTNFNGPLAFFGTPRVLEPSPGQLSGDAGLHPIRPFDRRRGQVRASLRALRPKIDRLAAGQFDSSDRQRQLIPVLARIAAAEMDYRAKQTESE
jgi:hypothetical protein